MPLIQIGPGKYRFVLHGSTRRKYEDPEEFEKILGFDAKSDEYDIVNLLGGREERRGLKRMRIRNGSHSGSHSGSHER